MTGKKGWLQVVSHGHWPRRLRARVRLAFGVTAGSRTSLVQNMLRRHAKSAPTYWFQLLLAMALATLGLVLGSTGVVIGAMLISPLMGPIVELGMGFAVGSPLLTIRSLVRVASSIVGVVGSAALITLALPFQEVTGEIAARTLPTLLDLLVAICCALAAAFTTVRPGSDAAGAAAGTAIGIALVPPLCVVGFGLGTGRAEVAGGAALLFVTNFCAILLFTTLSFLLLAFDRVDPKEAEAEQLKRGEATYRAARWLQKVFGSAYGPLLRVALPLLLVALVSVPLSQALREVSWQVRARQRVLSLLEELPPQGTVRSELTVERRAVRVQLVIMGSPERAVELERQLTERISLELSATPTVSVVAVPDVETMRQMARTLRPTPEAPPPPAPARLAEVGSRVGEALRVTWPTTAAGELLRWRLDLTNPGAPRVEVVHLGSPLGAAGETLLGRALGERLGTPVRLRDIALRAGWEGSESPPDVQWWLELARALQATSEVDGFQVCVETPPQAPVAPAPKRAVPASTLREQTARDEALARLTRMAEGRAGIVSGTRWNIRLQREPCIAPPTVGTETSAKP